MRRWTDGKSWSASRVSGSFLTYREMEGQRRQSPDRKKKRGAQSGGESPKSDSDPIDNGYRYKPGGLFKQSFSIVTANNLKFHLISYYTKEDVAEGRLLQPSMDPELKDIQIPIPLYPDTAPSVANVSPPLATGPLGHQWDYTKQQQHPMGAMPHTPSMPVPTVGNVGTVGVTPQMGPMGSMPMPQMQPMQQIPAPMAVPPPQVQHQHQPQQQQSLQPMQQIASVATMPPVSVAAGPLRYPPSPYSAPMPYMGQSPAPSAGTSVQLPPLEDAEPDRKRLKSDGQLPSPPNSTKAASPPSIPRMVTGAEGDSEDRRALSRLDSHFKV